MMFTNRKRPGVLRRVSEARSGEHSQAAKVEGLTLAVQGCLPLTRDESKNLRPMVKAFRREARLLSVACDKLERMLKTTK